MENDDCSKRASTDKVEQSVLDELNTIVRNAGAKGTFARRCKKCRKYHYHIIQ